MIKRFLSVSLLYFFLIQNPSTAQPFIDLINIQGQRSEPLSKDSSHIGTEYISADLSIPIKIKKDYLAIGASYSELRINSDRFDQINLHSILLSTAFVKQWKNEKAKTSLILIGRTNKDPDDKTTSNTVQWGAALLHTIQKKIF